MSKSETNPKFKIRILKTKIAALTDFDIG